MIFFKGHLIILSSPPHIYSFWVWGVCSALLFIRWDAVFCLYRQSSVCEIWTNQNAGYPYSAVHQVHNVRYYGQWLRCCCISVQCVALVLFTLCRCRASRVAKQCVTSNDYQDCYVCVYTFVFHSVQLTCWFLCNQVQLLNLQSLT